MEKSTLFMAIICLVCISVAAFSIASAEGLIGDKDDSDTGDTATGWGFEAYNAYGQPVEGKKIATGSKVAPEAIITHGGYEYQNVEFYKLSYTVENVGDIDIDRVKLGVLEWMFADDYGTCGEGNYCYDGCGAQTNQMSSILSQAFKNGYNEQFGGKCTGPSECEYVPQSSCNLETTGCEWHNAVTGAPDYLDLGFLAAGDSVTLKTSLIQTQGFENCIQPVRLQLYAYGEVDSIPCTQCKGNLPEDEAFCNGFDQVACYGQSKCHYDLSCPWPQATGFISISFDSDKTAQLDANFDLDIN